MSGVELRTLRQAVHGLLDPLWQNAHLSGGYSAKRIAFLSGPGGHAARKVARERVYAWLAEQMWLTAYECHVARFTATQCRQAVGHLQAVTYAEIRVWSRNREYQDDVLKRAAQRRMRRETELTSGSAADVGDGAAA